MKTRVKRKTQITVTMSGEEAALLASTISSVLSLSVKNPDMPAYSRLVSSGMIDRITAFRTMLSNALAMEAAEERRERE
jgi:hypothetical protein